MSPRLTVQHSTALYLQLAPRPSIELLPPVKCGVLITYWLSQHKNVVFVILLQYLKGSGYAYVSHTFRPPV